MAPPQAAPVSPTHAASVGESSSGGFACCRLLTWKNPVTSSAVFVGVNLVYFFVFALGKSFLSLMCYFFLLPFAVGLLFKLLDLAPSSASAGVSSLQPARHAQETPGGGAVQTPVEVVSQETVEEWTRCLYESVNTCLACFRDVVLWKSPLLSMKCALLTWAAGYCASFFSLSFLLFIFLWTAFGFSFLKKVVYDGFFLPVVAPHLARGKKKVQQLVSAIPKMKDVSK